MKNISRLMLALLISSVCIGATLSVMALSENETISDGTDDVIDSLGEIVRSSPYVDINNIDITELKYTRDNKQVTLTLTVNGIIQNKGSLSDLLLLNGLGGDNPDITDFNIDAVGYYFTLTTDNESYSIFYVNNACQLQYASDPEHPVNLSSSAFSVLDDTLTIYFELTTADEPYEDVSAQSSYIKLKFSLDDLNNLDENANIDDLMTIYTDDAPNPPLMVEASISNLGTTSGGAYLGTVGKTIQFNGSAVYGQPPYTYEWTFGDGTTSTETTPTHIYQQAKTYSYNFTVTDHAGNKESQSGSIIISAEEPNGDGDKGNINMLLLIGIILIIVVIGAVVIVMIIRR